MEFPKVLNMLVTLCVFAVFGMTLLQVPEQSIITSTSLGAGSARNSSLIDARSLRQMAGSMILVLFVTAIVLTRRVFSYRKGKDLCCSTTPTSVAFCMTPQATLQSIQELVTVCMRCCSFINASPVCPRSAHLTLHISAVLCCRWHGTAAHSNAPPAARRCLRQGLDSATQH